MQKLSVPASLKAQLKNTDLIEWLIPFLAQKYHTSPGRIAGLLNKPDEELSICLDRWWDDGCAEINRALLTQWWANIYPDICVWNKQQKQKFRCYNHPQQLFELSQEEFKQLLTLYWLERRLKGTIQNNGKENKPKAVKHETKNTDNSLVTWLTHIHTKFRKYLSRR